MIDVPLSIVAWVSVVLIQAIIHYAVLGFRPLRKKDNVIASETDSNGSNDNIDHKTAPPGFDGVTESANDDHNGNASTSSSIGSSPTISCVDSADADEQDYSTDDTTASTISNDQRSYRSPRSSVDFAVEPHEAIVRRSLYSVIRNEDLLDGDEPPDFMEILTQTGSELLKSKSVECLVQEQIEMRSQ